MKIGIDSFAVIDTKQTSSRNVDRAQAMSDLIEQIEAADEAGIAVFGIGEHHRPEFLDSAPTLILAAAARRTKRIRLSSAVTVLSADDPVRVFQQFATLDLISNGRAEMTVGRGSFGEAYPLFGLNVDDYDALFSEKLLLLLKIRQEERPIWSGTFRPSLNGVGIYPRPVQHLLPIRVGVGGTPASFARAGTLGLPLTLAIIGGEPARFRSLIDLYREAGRRAGHAESSLDVAVHAVGYIAETDQQAAEDFYPGYAAGFTRIGRERGWPPVTRAQFDAGSRPEGALIVGSPQKVLEKLRYYDHVLGGISRVSFQMNVASLCQDRLIRATKLLGQEVVVPLSNPLSADLE